VVVNKYKIRKDILKGILPPIDVVNRYWQRYDTLDPPQVVMNMADGREYVLEQGNVYYDPKSRKYSIFTQGLVKLYMDINLKSKTIIVYLTAARIHCKKCLN
jgi:hypothetical protein